MSWISRRTFLRAAGGLCVGLPILEATHHGAWAQSQDRAKRLIVMFSHGGTINCRARGDGRLYSRQNSAHHGLNAFAPLSGSGAPLRLGPIMQPLEDAGLTEDLLVLQGVDNRSGMTVRYGGGHRSSNVTALTAADFESYTRTSSSGSESVYMRALGPSIDQVVAQRLQARAPSPFESVNLTVYGHQYGSPQFRGARTSVSAERNPKTAFESLFAGVNATPEAELELRRIRLRRRSILDGVLVGLRRFREKVSVNDRHLLDEHMTHVRELERRLQALGDTSISCVVPELDPQAGARNFDRLAEFVGPMMVDIVIHALRCGLTQVATLQISDVITSWLSTPWSRGNTSLGHSLHHAGRDVGRTGTSPQRFDDWEQEMLINRRWRMQLMSRLLLGLKTTPEGDSNMLHNSVVLYTSEFGYGAIHSVRDQPFLLAGAAGGQWRTNRGINYNSADLQSDPRAYESQTSNHNVFTSILNAFGESDEHFGNAAAPFQGPLDFS
jgi:hypothetical protein